MSEPCFCGYSVLVDACGYVFQNGAVCGLPLAGYIHEHSFKQTLRACGNKLPCADHPVSQIKDARYDALRESVVAICLESRAYPADKQAAFLRDSLLTMIDPLMNITQRLKERAAAKGGAPE